MPGRNPDSLGIDAGIPVGSGTPDEWRARAEEWLALGVTHLTLISSGAGFETPQHHLDRLHEALEALRAA